MKEGWIVHSKFKIICHRKDCIHIIVHMTIQGWKMVKTTPYHLIIVYLAKRIKVDIPSFSYTANDVSIPDFEDLSS